MLSGSLLAEDCLAPLRVEDDGRPCRAATTARQTRSESGQLAPSLLSVSTITQRPMDSPSHTERSDDSHAFIPTAVTASPDGRPAAAGPAATSSTSRPDLVGSRPPSTAQAMLHSPPPAASARLVARENKEVENDELKQTAARLLGLDNGARPKLAAATPGAAGGSSSQGSTTGKQLPAILGLGVSPK